ncbi:DNA polymerase III subunit gamma/tau [Nitriliruptoraceae bacterium ZYF776]|nr:DNA polymerase III subunit gamma/tau [Profundirhabdus halotolerans]
MPGPSTRRAVQTSWSTSPSRSRKGIRTCTSSSSAGLTSGSSGLRRPGRRRTGGRPAQPDVSATWPLAWWAVRVGRRVGRVHPVRCRRGAVACGPRGAPPGRPALPGRRPSPPPRTATRQELHPVAYVSLYRTYRPATFDDVVGQAHVIRTLVNAIEEERLHHAYLFTGPRGTGKTSTARILAKAINCEQGPTPTPCLTCDSCREIADGSSVDVIELDMASHGGVDDARDLRDRALFAPARSRRKVYILDEVHMASTAAFNALLKLIEEPPSHVLFAMATTDPQKVLPTILSRVQRLDLRRVSASDVAAHVRELCQAEGYTIDDGAVDAVVRAGDGSVRDTLSVLEQVLAFAGRDVTAEAVAAVLGHTPADRVVEAVDALAERDLAGLLGLVQGLLDEGHDLRRFTLDLVQHLRDLLVLQVAPDRPDLVDATDDRRRRLQAQTAALPQATLLRAVGVLAETLAEQRQGPPRLPLELALATLATPGSDGDVVELGDRVARLEAGGVARSGAASSGGASSGGSSPRGSSASSSGTSSAARQAPAADGEVAPAAEGAPSGGGRAAAAAAARAASSRGARPTPSPSGTVPEPVVPDPVVPEPAVPDPEPIVPDPEPIVPDPAPIVPDPAPEPSPVPDPEPAPDPSPVPDPVPDPTPAPEPSPVPEPVPDPTPAPVQEVPAAPTPASADETPAEDAPAAEAPAEGTATSSSASDDPLAQVTASWSGILDLVKGRSRRCHAVFEPATPTRVRNRILTLSYPRRYASFHAANAGKGEFAEVMVAAIEQATGLKLRIEPAVAGEEDRRPHPPSVTPDDARTPVLDDGPSADEMAEVREAESAAAPPPPADATATDALLARELGAELLEERAAPEA